MYQPTTIQEPNELEQVVVSTLDGLRRLEQILPYEFEETIYQIQHMFALKTMQDYAEASGKGQARRIVEINRTMTEEEFINRYSGKEATDRAKEQVRAIYGEAR